MLKKRSAYRVLARRASGAHVLNGPIMLHRMAKRVRAAEHHFCHPIASRCGRSTGRALQRPPRPRFASSRRALLTRVGLAHHPARTVACCVGEVRPVAERHAFGHPRPPSRCHPMGGTGRSPRCKEKGELADSLCSVCVVSAQRMCSVYATVCLMPFA
jgi:hypothetical protein